MFIAVSNNHGWGKAASESEAIKLAVDNSMSRKATVIALWACVDDAYVDGMGTAHGVTSARRRFERKNAIRGTWKEVPDTA